MASLAIGSREYQVRVGQLERLQLRAHLLLRALRVFYAALGSFAAAALMSVVGSILAYYGWEIAFRARRKPADRNDDDLFGAQAHPLRQLESVPRATLGV